MAITRHDIADAQGADKKFLLTAIQLEDATQEVLNQFADDAYDEIMRNASASGLQNQNDVITALIDLLAAALLLFDSKMEDGIRSIAKVKRDLYLEEGLPLLRSAGANEAANRFKTRLGNFEDDMAISFRTMKSGKYELSYNDRMQAIEESSQRVIRNLIQSGVRDGLDPKVIAQRLDRYVNPAPTGTPVRPWDVIRNATKSNKSFVPEGVLPGSIQSNVFDVARTQASLSNRAAANRMADPEPWIIGFKWVLSSSHPRDDECDEKAAANPYPKGAQQPDSHNHCLCDWIPIYASRDQIRALLAQGDL